MKKKPFMLFKNFVYFRLLFPNQIQFSRTPFLFGFFFLVSKNTYFDLKKNGMPFQVDLINNKKNC